MSKVKCLNCGEILESKHVHDFQMCNCSNETFVDGGNEYTRCGGYNFDLIEVIKESKSDEALKMHLKALKEKNKELKCPECGSTNVNQYRMLTGAIWCGDCYYTAPEKEKHNPFIIDE